jgi:putative phosphoribosyl transferase
MFFDRYAAGTTLAQKLRQYKNRDVVIYALPTGGVPVGYEVSRALNLPLDILIVQKIGHPISREYGICAVSEDGQSVKDECGLCGLDESWLNFEIAEKIVEAERRRYVYKRDEPSVSAENKIAIIIDDGITTGLTIRAAIQTVQDQWPEQIIVATPAAPHEVVRDLRQLVDGVIIGFDDREYRGTVNSYYVDNSEVTDEDVTALLADANRRFINNLREGVEPARSYVHSR